MSEEQNKKSALPFSLALLIVAIITGGVVSHFSPLESLRPSKTQKEAEPPIEEEKVLARMWQDPFQAVEHAIKDAKAKRHKFPIPLIPEKEEKQVQYKIFQCNEAKKILVMPVMMTAGTNADQSEERLRTRYAILSALHVAGYKPNNATHIAVFKTKINRYVRSVPYELYFKDILHVDKVSQITNKCIYDAVLVLWLGDEYFSEKKRWKEIESIMENVDQVIKKENIKENVQVQYNIIGPQYTTGLVGVPKKTKLNDKDYKIFSPWANADPYLIKRTEKNESLNDISVIIKEKDSNYQDKIANNEHFISTIHDYSALTDTLVDELDRRGIDLSIDDGNDHVVIIGEWDSLYGRASQISFAMSVQKKRVSKKPQNLIHYCWPQRVHSITYMSGVDGKLPYVKDDASAVNNYDSNTKNTSSNDFEKLVARYEQPQGLDQYDYLRRLPELVKSKVTTPNKIRAIGVMGVDVYDKLLMLRALRYEFPNAFFFTTDLDARLWHHTERFFTRNLIVASGYGLQLNKDWQQDILPFRSSYQTSVFAAALMSLGVLKKEMVDLNKINPRIYEIGRRGAYDLTSDDIQQNIHPELPHQWKPKSLLVEILFLFGLFIPSGLVASFIYYFYLVFRKQNTPSIRYKRICGYIWCAVLIIFVLTTIYNLEWRTFFTKEITSLVYLFVFPTFIISCLVYAALYYSKGEPWCKFLCPNAAKAATNFAYLRYLKWLWVAWVILFAIFAVLAIISSLSSNGEPITFFDSISVWPSELIRVFNGFLATYFLALSYRHIKRRRYEIKVMLTNQKGKSLCREITDQFDNYENSGQQRKVNTYLEKYWKSGLASFLHLLIGNIAIWMYGYPLIPARGKLCSVLDTIILLFSLYLIFFFYWHTVLEMLKCQKFIKGLINTKDKKHDYCFWHTVIKVIAVETEAHAKIVKYPFILLLFLCIARYNYFDNWRWTIPLVVIVVSSILIMICVSTMLFHEANVARQKVVDRLNNDIIKLTEHKRKIYRQECKRLEINIDFAEHIIKDILNIKSGAFVPLSYNPILLSSLTPLGGVGIINLLQNLYR